MLVTILFGKENCITDLLSREIVMLRVEMFAAFVQVVFFTLNNCFYDHFPKLLYIILSYFLLQMQCVTLYQWQQQTVGRESQFDCVSVSCCIAGRVKHSTWNFHGLHWESTATFVVSGSARRMTLISLKPQFNQKQWVTITWALPSSLPGILQHIV